MRAAGVAVIDKPKPLSEEQLLFAEKHLAQGVTEAELLRELVRVYREAKAFDSSDDVSPFHRFFSLEAS